MKMSLLKGLPQIVQIHASKRTDRAALTEVWTTQHGVHIELFEAIMDKDGRKGCALSHSAVARHATPYLVLEDDAVPTLHALTDIQGLVDIRDALKSYDIIYLGGWPLANRSSKFLTLQEGACLCTHAMIVGERAAIWLRNFKFSKTPIDVALARAPLKFAWTRHEWFSQAQSASDVNGSALTKSKIFMASMQLVSTAWRFVMLHRLVCFLAMLYLLRVSLLS